MGYPYRYFSAKLIRGFIWDIPIVIFAYVPFWGPIKPEIPISEPCLGPQTPRIGSKGFETSF